MAISGVERARHAPRLGGSARSVVAQRVSRAASAGGAQAQRHRLMRVDCLLPTRAATLYFGLEKSSFWQFAHKRSYMKSLNLALGASFALSLAGCLPQTTTDKVYYARTGVPSVFRYAAAGRDFRTMIYGNPTVASKDAFDDAVIAAMQGRNWGPRTNFTTTPSENAREAYRVVMIFSGDRYFGGDAACRDVDESALAPVSDWVELQSAFCFRDQALSYAHVRTAAFRAPDDPRLGDAVSQAVLHLFPLRDLDIKRDRDPKFLVP